MRDEGIEKVHWKQYSRLDSIECVSCEVFVILMVLVVLHPSNVLCLVPYQNLQIRVLGLAWDIAEEGAPPVASRVPGAERLELIKKFEDLERCTRQLSCCRWLGVKRDVNCWLDVVLTPK